MGGRKGVAGKGEREKERNVKAEMRRSAREEKKENAKQEEQ